MQIILPRVLKKLLQARKDTRKTQKNYKKDDFKWSLLEGLQLAYKVTCNSLYGQIGAKTSPVCKIELAASTTAVGRELLQLARDMTLKNYPNSEITLICSSYNYSVANIYSNDLKILIYQSPFFYFLLNNFRKLIFKKYDLVLQLDGKNYSYLSSIFIRSKKNLVIPTVLSGFILALITKIS